MKIANADVIPLAEATNTFVADVEDKAANPAAHMGFKTRFPELGFLTGHLQRVALYYIFGKSKVGKSAAVSTLVHDMIALGNVSWIWFALEETIAQSVGRLIAVNNGVSRTKYRDIKLDPADWTKLYLTRDTLTNKLADGYFVDEAFEIEQITEICKDLKPDVIFLDYLQLIHMSGTKSMNEMISGISKHLIRMKKGKVTGKKHCIICTGHLNDDGQPLHSRDPLRDGDVFAELSTSQVSSALVAPNVRDLKITYNRLGPVGEMTVAFFGDRSMLGPLQFNTAPSSPPLSSFTKKP